MRAKAVTVLGVAGVLLWAGLGSARAPEEVRATAARAEVRLELQSREAEQTRGSQERPVTARDVWQAEVELAAVLAEGGVGTQAEVAKLGVASSWELRGVAARVRAAGLQLQQGATRGTTRGTEALLRVLERGRRVAKTVWPGVVLGLDGHEIASAIEAAAGDAEARSIRAWQTWAAGAAARGERRGDGIGELVLPRAADRRLTRARRGGELDAVFRAHRAVRAAWDATLDEAAGGNAGVAAVWRRSSPRRMTAVLTAVSRVGSPYQFAARGPEKFDCSGLMVWAWAEAGLQLRGSSLAQMSQVVTVEADELRSGDLVLRASGRENPVGEADGHVAMVLGVTRDEIVIIDASSIAGKVRVTTQRRGALVMHGRVRLAEERIAKLVMPGSDAVWEPAD